VSDQDYIELYGRAWVEAQCDACRIAIKVRPDYDPDKDEASCRKCASRLPIKYDPVTGLKPEPHMTIEWVLASAQREKVSLLEFGALLVTCLEGVWDDKDAKPVCSCVKGSVLRVLGGTWERAGDNALHALNLLEHHRSFACGGTLPDKPGVYFG
jgi:hypothetical protein